MRSSKGQPPYRESLLTRVLSDSFASEQAMVVAIGTVSPSAKDTEHSIGTLRALQQLQGTQMCFEEREDLAKPKQEVDLGGCTGNVFAASLTHELCFTRHASPRNSPDEAEQQFCLLMPRVILLLCAKEVQAHPKTWSETEAGL